MPGICTYVHVCTYYINCIIHISSELINIDLKKVGIKDKNYVMLSNELFFSILFPSLNLMMNSKTYISLFILALWYQTTNAASCEIFPPNGTDGNEIGFIFVPGAQIKGEAYGPLSFKIQSLFPGKMWVGLTEGWFGNFPNPLEVSGAIADCYSKAS